MKLLMAQFCIAVFLIISLATSEVFGKDNEYKPKEPINCTLIKCAKGFILAPDPYNPPCQHCVLDNGSDDINVSIGIVPPPIEILCPAIACVFPDVAKRRSLCPPCFPRPCPQVLCRPGYPRRVNPVTGCVECISKPEILPSKE